MAIAPPPSATVRCRQIVGPDIEEVIALLTRGFPGRKRQFWMRGFERQADRPTPPNCPKFGYVLESDGVLVGVLLLLFTSVAAGAEAAVRCNLSSWYVDPAFRNYASLLASVALKHKGVTYIN